MGILELFSQIPGQDRLADELKAHLADPKNSYFFIGAEDVGAVKVIQTFAKAIMCEHDGCGICASCIAIERGVHPDVFFYQRVGAALRIDDAREIVSLAYRSTSGSKYQIIVVPELELVDRAAPALLKSVEEPPLSTIFMLQASTETPELRTLTSRSVVFRLDSISDQQIYQHLIDTGISAENAERSVRLSAGNLERAIELSTDHQLSDATAIWEEVPTLVTQNLPLILNLVDRLLEAVSLREERKKLEHKRELDEAGELAKSLGVKKASLTEKIEARQKRELRRIRTTDLRSGLLLLERQYRSSYLSSDTSESKVKYCIKAIELIEDTQLALKRNANEFLLIMALFTRLADISN